jgi:hypothetical protein
MDSIDLEGLNEKECIDLKNHVCRYLKQKIFRTQKQVYLDKYMELHGSVLNEAFLKKLVEEAPDLLSEVIYDRIAYKGVVLETIVRHGVKILLERFKSHLRLNEHLSHVDNFTSFEFMFQTFGKPVLSQYTITDKTPTTIVDFIVAHGAMCDLEYPVEGSSMNATLRRLAWYGFRIPSMPSFYTDMVIRSAKDRQRLVRKAWLFLNIQKIDCEKRKKNFCMQVNDGDICHFFQYLDIIEDPVVIVAISSFL